MDILKGYTSQTLQLKADYEGEVIATLISSEQNKGNRKSVLYIHGYVDYFFQAHLGEEFNANNFDFYALDLRKYGRSLLPHQHPNYCKDLYEYFEEIGIAIRQIYNQSNGEVFLLGHSTGGLIASLYMNDGKEKNLIKALILNSPFLDFNQTNLEKTAVYLLTKPLATLFPYSKVNGTLSPAYVESIHENFYGEWNFNLTWKPLKGFPAYFPWILAVRNGHKRLNSSNIDVPVLVLHSNRSDKLSTYSEVAKQQDIVLNVEDIKRVGAKLGNRVTLLEIKNALHDVFLSSKEVREIVCQELFDWIDTLN